jgi:hypothetical protein
MRELVRRASSKNRAYWWATQTGRRVARIAALQARGASLSIQRADIEDHGERITVLRHEAAGEALVVVVDNPNSIDDWLRADLTKDLGELHTNLTTALAGLTSLVPAAGADAPPPQLLDLERTRLDEPPQPADTLARVLTIAPAAPPAAANAAA